jgi:serine/threonine protein phosphatase PrpC
MGAKGSKLPPEHFLSKPNTRVEMHGGQTDFFTYGHASMQGWRRTNEDAHIEHVFGNPSNAFFAIIDGHSGDAVALATEARLPVALEQELPLYFTSASGDVASLESLEKGITEAFLHHDRQMADDVTLRLTYAGSTCVSAFVSASHVTFANLGDSRGVFVRENRALFATQDHKPTDDKETARIYTAGGTVLSGRIDGALAVSRSFGDFTFKSRSDLPRGRQKVSPEPDITSIARGAGPEYLLLACDGVWDVMDVRTAVAFVNQQLAKGKRTPQQVCAKLISKCLSLGSQDNISALLIVLLPVNGSAPFPVQSPLHTPGGSTRPKSTHDSVSQGLSAIVDTVVANVIECVLSAARSQELSGGKKAG